MISGARLFVKALKAENVGVLFAYPGGQAIDLFDALYDDDDINIILPRHEQGLAHAADGYARSTGRPGVCLVTSGPGATNLVTAIATANYDSVPLVCFTGQVPTGLIGNDAFQEADIVGMVRSITKYAVTVRSREMLGPIIKKAFTIATTGRPGAVLVDIPKDVQQAQGSDEYPSSVEIRGYNPAVAVHMGQIKKALAACVRAKRPLLLAGGGVHIAKAEKRLAEFVGTTGMPVVTTIMGRGALPTDSPLYFGNIGIHGAYGALTAVRECDLLLSVGTRFNDRVAGSPETFAANAEIVHIDIDPASISRTVRVDIPIVGDAANALAALAKYSGRLDIAPWVMRLRALRAACPVHMESTGLCAMDVINGLNALPGDLIVATDVGQNQMWTTQFLMLNERRKLLTSGGLGTMGFGLPAAIGAKLGNPGVTVAAVVGDGGFQMNVQELATAVINGLPIIICLLNNGWLGNVRQWQELYYGGRYQSTCLRRRSSCPRRCTANDVCPAYVPDFGKLAESYGAAYMRVTDKSEVSAAFDYAARQKNVPTVLEFMIGAEDNVYPIVMPGRDISTIMLGKEIKR